MNKIKNKRAENVDHFYEYCWSNNKLTDKDVDKILILAAINNGEITDGMLRGYLPINWASCVRIAKQMDDCGVAKYVDQFSEPMVQLPSEDRQGLWAVAD